MSRLSIVCGIVGTATIGISLLAAVLIGVNNIPTGLIVGVGGVSLGIFWLAISEIIHLLTDISTSLKRGNAPPQSIQRLPKD